MFLFAVLIIFALFVMDYKCDKKSKGVYIPYIGDFKYTNTAVGIFILTMIVTLR